MSGQRCLLRNRYQRLRESEQVDDAEKSLEALVQVEIDNANVININAAIIVCTKACELIARRMGLDECHRWV